MTIDDAIETLLDTRSYGTADIAKSVAIDTMRKYQLMQADYENRLKADMVAMLTEIQLEIEELETSGDVLELAIKDDCKDIIQQKINSLKEG